MFTLNQQVICTNAGNQPTLQDGMTYIVREVGERGIRVRSATGDIRYEFANGRFRAATVAAMPLEVRRAIELAEYGGTHTQPIGGREGILIVDDLAYRVSIEESSLTDVWELRTVVYLSF